jgi:hypothetical protein
MREGPTHEEPVKAQLRSASGRSSKVIKDRQAVVLLGAMLLALALVVLASAVASKKADAATQIVTKTFNKPEQLHIPAGANVSDCDSGPTQGVTESYPSQRSIQSFPAGSTISDVNLVLRDYTHSFPDDVGVLLSKGGRNRLVMDNVGGPFGVNDINLTLNDEAATHLPNDEQLVSGSFKPTNPFNATASLSGFDGLSPNGTWNMRVADKSKGDCGEFGDGWSLIIRARVH